MLNAKFVFDTDENGPYKMWALYLDPDPHRLVQISSYAYADMSLADRATLFRAKKNCASRGEHGSTNFVGLAALLSSRCQRVIFSLNLKI